MANTYFNNNGHFYAKHTFPALIDCNFQVAAGDAGGLGQINLKGPGVSAVYMHTSTTAAAGSPNPASGVIMVVLSDDYNRYYGGYSEVRSPGSGSNVTTTTASTAYTITSLGTATAAQWAAKGLPTGITAATGASFIATASGTIGGSAAVQVVKTTGSGIDHIEVMGDPSQTLSAYATSTGGVIVLNCFFEGAVTQPADGTIIHLGFYLSNSSVMVAGE